MGNILHIKTDNITTYTPKTIERDTNYIHVSKPGKNGSYKVFIPYTKLLCLEISENECLISLYKQYN